MTHPLHMSTTAPRDHDSACVHVASLFRNPWLKKYVRGKLRIDPMYGDSSCRFKLINAVERLGRGLRWHKGSTITFPRARRLHGHSAGEALPKIFSRCGVGRRSTIICSCFVARTRVPSEASLACDDPPYSFRSGFHASRTTLHVQAQSRRTVQRASGRVRSGTCLWT